LCNGHYQNSYSIDALPFGKLLAIGSVLAHRIIRFGRRRPHAGLSAILRRRVGVVPVESDEERGALN
jgi:hypothetical protein